MKNKGFVKISESESWIKKVVPNGKYFFTKNQSTIVAFAVGGKYKPGVGGIKIIGAHTDSPDLKLKPISKKEKIGFLQCGVQTYGGGLWYTWFDRDLTVCGRVIVKNKDGSFESRLVEIKKPILRIPSLAIHLDREVNSKFSPNLENHLTSVLSTNIEESLNSSDNITDEELTSTFSKNHHSVLLRLLAKELQVSPNAIHDFELSLVDVQDSTIGGAHDEFIFSGRLDNLLSCFCALDGFENTLDSLDKDTDIRCIVFFDHEEIGSLSSHGADSTTLPSTIRRLATVLTDENSPKDVLDIIIKKSFIISADMAHAVHPNYSDKHESNSQIKIHEGPTIKINTNQRYATNAVTGFLFKTLAEKNNIPYQQFVVRQDMGCGSTIGPISSANTGIRTVDVGIPQLSMHSIREMCGIIDVQNTSKLFGIFFEQFRELDDKLKVDN